MCKLIHRYPVISAFIMIVVCTIWAFNAAHLEIKYGLRLPYLNGPKDGITEYGLLVIGNFVVLSLFVYYQTLNKDKIFSKLFCNMSDIVMGTLMLVVLAFVFINYNY